MSSAKLNHWRFIKWARTTHVGDGGEKAILNALATYADWETGVCVVKQQTLAAHCEMGVSTANEKLKGLTAKGLIARKKRGQQGARLADEITLTPSDAYPLPPETGTSEEPTTSRFPGTTSQSQRSQHPDPADGTLLSEPTYKNPPRAFSDFGKGKDELDALLDGVTTRVLPAGFPDSEHIRRARGLLEAAGLYYEGKVDLQEIVDQFVAHAAKSNVKFRSVEGAWVAWVKKAIQRVERSA